MDKRVGLAAIVLCGAMAITGCSSQEETVAVNESEAATAVEVMTISEGEIENEYIYSGKVNPVQEANVYSTVAGKVGSVNFEVGDTVQEGDILFTMDKTDIQNSINQLNASIATAEANIQSAQTTLDTVNGATMQLQIENARVAMENAKLAYDNAKESYDNNKALYESGVIAKTTFDQVESAYEQAKLAYEQASTTYDITANQMPAENQKKAEDAYNIAVASRNAAQSQLASAQKSLRDADVRSPLTGVVSARNAVEGTVLSQTMAAYTVIDISSVNMEVNVSEQAINSIQQGDQVSVYIRTVSSTPYTGEVTVVSPAASQTGTYTVKIEIPNEDGSLKPGMFGEVHFVREKADSAFVLPRGAVIEQGGEQFVFVEEDGVAHQITVTTGIDNGQEVEITSGIEAGDRVVVQGQNYLDDGDRVNVTSDLKEE